MNSVLSVVGSFLQENARILIFQENAKPHSIQIITKNSSVFLARFPGETEVQIYGNSSKKEKVGWILHRLMGSLKLMFRWAILQAMAPKISSLSLYKSLHVFPALLAFSSRSLSWKYFLRNNSFSGWWEERKKRIAGWKPPIVNMHVFLK